MPLRDRILKSKQKISMKGKVLQIDLKGRLQGNSTIWFFSRVYNDSPQEGCSVVRFKKKKTSQNLIVSIGSIRKVRRII